MLDTSFDAAQLAKVQQILQLRGIKGKRKLWLQIVVFSGLWWNIIWGEWLALGLKDIAYGWCLNIGLASGLGIGCALYQILMHFTLLDQVLSLFAAVPVGLLSFALVVKRLKPVLLRRYAV
jgi:hypothetical protein